MMYTIYNILYCLVLLFILPFEYFRRPKGLRTRWLRERFGFVPVSATRASGPVWIHAVSVGEVVASVPLLNGLKSAYPDREIVLSTVTDTGQKVAGERIGDLARIIYAPFDVAFAVAAAFKRIRPSLFIIMETELWPAIITYFSRHGAPVLLMNGRLSDKSVKGYRKLRFFFGRVLGEMSFFCMQNEEYARRIISLGANEKAVRAIGNFKFDTKPAAPVPAWAGMLKGPVIIAGSTHRGEEDLVLDTYIKLLETMTRLDLNLILAPRHPERFGEVEEIAREKGIKYLKRSEIKDSAELPGASGLVVILDVMGELASAYGAADIAIMGGSFIEHGGQNPLEPAFWGKAIVCGPHMENFPFMDDFYRKGAAVKSESENLYGTVKEILDSPDLMLRMGRAAKEFYEQNAGATGRALQIIERYLLGTY